MENKVKPARPLQTYSSVEEGEDEKRILRSVFLVLYLCSISLVNLYLPLYWAFSSRFCTCNIPRPWTQTDRRRSWERSAPEHSLLLRENCDIWQGILKLRISKKILSICVNTTKIGKLLLEVILIYRMSNKSCPFL